VNAEYLLESESLCIAMKDGDVLLYHCNSQQIECVGSVESGINCMAWSPDQELVLLSTAESKIIMMTKDFDVITEISSQTEDFGENKPINVGWGKKETQFHGSAGKPKVGDGMEKAPVPVADWDDGLSKLSWRGDGQYFVCNVVNQTTGARQLRFWSREGILQSTSENSDGLEGPLHWRPSGNLIATAQRKPQYYNVLFFERNGLRRSEFTLPFSDSETRVIDLVWNLDSKLLAVRLETTTFHNDMYLSFSVQLWFCNNSHWYCKQEISFTTADRIACIQWDTDVSYRLHIATFGGKYLQYNWYWDVDYSQAHVAGNLSSVAVIDGDRLLVTPFSIMVMPPPMSAYYIKAESSINQVCFGPSGISNDFAIVLANMNIAIYTYCDGPDTLTNEKSIKLSGTGGVGFKTSLKLPRLQGTFKLFLKDSKPINNLYQLQHLSWLTSNKFLAIMWDDCNMKNYLLYLHLIEDEEKRIIVRDTLELPKMVLRLVTNHDTLSTIIQYVDGSVWRYCHDDHMKLIPWLLPNGMSLQLPQPCQYIATAVMNDSEVVIGSNERFRIYINDKEIANNCTSFCVHDSFLIFSTHSHTCRFVSLLSDWENIRSYPTNESAPFDENVRRMERGSKIVLAVSDSTKLVFQMPRGNLEAIHPRALLLHSVRRLLDKLNFGEAFLLMRKHRINSNLLYDHNPKGFMENIDIFIRQIDDVNFINLFLSDLREEDVTITMYTAEQSRPSSSIPLTGSKIDKICDAVRESLTLINFNKYILSVITSYVKKTTAELDKALQLIKSLADKTAVSEGGVSYLEALKYLLVLVDVNELYNVALGMYDFDIVLMVAERSQKDPKEYLPFLNSLKKMESNYSKYSIDKFLKKYDRAIVHLSRCGSEYFDELLQLIEKQKLYRQALSLYPVDSDRFKSICKKYGLYLKNIDNHLEAALMFAKGNEYELARISFIKCRNWQQAFCMASKLRFSIAETSKMANKIASKIFLLVRLVRCTKSSLAAATVLLDYANETEQAIVTLINGCLWNEALRLMHRHDRTDMIESHFLSALIDSYQAQSAYLKNSITQFRRHNDRLIKVREEKREKMQEVADGGDDGDLYSETTSITGRSTRSSIYSRTTGRTSKSRRKVERKRYSLREGSPYEDIALMEALSQMIRTLSTTKDDIRSLMEILIIFNHDSEAAVLQDILEEYMTTVKTSLKNIWPSDGVYHHVRLMLLYYVIIK
ncbi:uncharacterized protein TRIADDRAFT_22184, partial [Trichoplax adhaerens]